MAGKWTLPRALMGGTPSMRAAGRTYLPSEVKESEPAYQTRINRTFLNPAFGRTVLGVSAKPFQKPVVLSEKSPDPLKELALDVDHAGRALTTFAYDVFKEAMIDGISYIFVDHPTVGRNISLAEQRAEKIGPYFVGYPASDVIEVRTERKGAREVLSRVRIRENSVEQDGDWGETVVNRIRVYYQDRWEIWRYYPNRSNRDGSWAIEDEGALTLGVIPLVPVYTGFEGFFLASPPLFDLAWLNLKHWQSQSDQDNILHVARVPILFGAGLPQNTDLTVGVNTMITSENFQAKLEFVEHTGAAINSGQSSLDRLEEQMSELGYEPLIARARTGDLTATGREIDAAETNSRAQAWARALEYSFEQAFDYARAWMGLPERAITDSTVKVSSDFGLSLREAVDLDTLLQSRKGGDLSRETFWSELKRRGLLPDSFDPVAEQKLLDKEGVSLAQLLPATRTGPSPEQRQLPPPSNGNGNRNGNGEPRRTRTATATLE